MKPSASDWIKTDEAAVLSDIARLGLDAASEYQMGLLSDRVSDGDDRWSEISAESMRTALVALWESDVSNRTRRWKCTDGFVVKTLEAATAEAAAEAYALVSCAVTVVEVNTDDSEIAEPRRGYAGDNPMVTIRDQGVAQ